MALRFESTRSRSLASTMVSSFWVIRLENRSARALIHGQKGGNVKFERKYLSLEGVTSETSFAQPKSVAMISRQLATTHGGGGGSRDRE